MYILGMSFVLFYLIALHYILGMGLLKQYWVYLGDTLSQGYFASQFNSIAWKFDTA